jgi:hypothetical protein
VLVLVLVLPAFSPKAVPSIVELFIKFHHADQINRSRDSRGRQHPISLLLREAPKNAAAETSALVLRQLAFDHRRRQLGGFQSEHQAQLPRM